MLKIFGVRPFSDLFHEDATITLTGVAGTGTLNSVSATVTVTATVTGVAGTGTLNSVSATVTVTATVTGVAGTGTLNDVTVTGTATVTLTGVSGTGTLNDVVALAGDFAIIFGVSGTGTVNSPDCTGTATQTLTGVSSTGTLNNVVLSVDVIVHIAGTTSTSTFQGSGAFGGLYYGAGTGSDPAASGGGVSAIGVLYTVSGVGSSVAGGGSPDNAITGVQAYADVHMVRAYIVDSDGFVTLGGMALALVGDFVGTGSIELIPDPVNAQITYKGIPLALETATITTHTGLHHPSPPGLPATLLVGSPDCIVKGVYRLVRIGDPASCVDQVVMNPALLPVIARYNDLREPGNPPIA